MPQRSDVDRRARRYLAVQCVSDTGHKDAPTRVRLEQTSRLPRRLLVVPLREVLNDLKRNPQRWRWP
jgi:hypothetical protein